MVSSRFIPVTGTLLLLSLLSGCSQTHVTSQATAGTDFTKYQTYAIKPGNVAYPGASDAQRQEIERRIQEAVALQLEGRGLTPQPEGPELIVTYTAGARAADGPWSGGGSPEVRAPVGVDVRGDGGGYDEPGLVRAREAPDGGVGDAEVRRRYTEGSLVIDLLDGKSRKLVWRATANLELASAGGARAIDEVVARAFAELPLGRRAGRLTPPATTRQSDRATDDDGGGSSTTARSSR